MVFNIVECKNTEHIAMVMIEQSDVCFSQRVFDLLNDTIDNGNITVIENLISDEFKNAVFRAMLQKYMIRVIAKHDAINIKKRKLNNKRNICEDIIRSFLFEKTMPSDITKKECYIGGFNMHKTPRIFPSFIEEKLNWYNLLFRNIKRAYDYNMCDDSDVDQLAEFYFLYGFMYPNKREHEKNEYTSTAYPYIFGMNSEDLKCIDIGNVELYSKIANEVNKFVTPDMVMKIANITGENMHSSFMVSSASQNISPLQNITCFILFLKKCIYDSVSMQQIEKVLKATLLLVLEYVEHHTNFHLEKVCNVLNVLIRRTNALEENVTNVVEILMRIHDKNVKTVSSKLDCLCRYIVCLILSTSHIDELRDGAYGVNSLSKILMLKYNAHESLDERRNEKNDSNHSNLCQHDHENIVLVKRYIQNNVKALRDLDVLMSTYGNKSSILRENTLSKTMHFDDLCRNVNDIILKTEEKLNIKI